MHRFQNKVEKLLEINKILTQSLKIDDVLRNVIHAASELIDVSDVLIIYLYDEATNTLQFAEGEGVNKDKLKDILFSPGESIAGKVFDEKQSKLFASEKEIDTYMTNMSDTNYRAYFEGVYERKIKSAFCVPLINKDRCLGVLVVDNFNQDGVFTEEDMQVIEAVADQSAIAIDNSNVYRSLKEKNALLTQSISIHNQFYKLIIEEGGIDKVLALLESIIHSKVVHHPTLVYEETGMFFPIVRGKDVLGVLELEKKFQQFSDMDKIAIEHASMTIALELIKNNALYEKDLHFREEVFNQLLEGLAKEDLQRVLYYMQWDESWAVQCMVIEGDKERLWQQNSFIEKEWFVRSIEQITNAVTVNSFLFTRAYQLIIIIPKIKENAMDQIIRGIERKWGEKKHILYGVGRETEIQELSVSYKEAIRSIGYAKSIEDQHVVEYSKLGFERLLHEVDPAIIETFMRDKLNRLLVLDPTFMNTLRHLIESNKNHKKTAELLHIHPNTLYYRLKRIEEELRIDLNNEQNWVDLVIAVRLYVAGNKRNR
ncbi:helix-turn-helix domain-containing protein [Virgibacillus sp. W0181]|uniref:helix-turn-helix domain-containing protein n=1 Tax=Virgibacillus sp. W0181 TaxID=3391581 RepID=UPI003F48DE06